MKKQTILFFTFYIFLFFSYFSQVNALLDEDLGLDLYKDIESGIDDLELKQYNYNLTNGGEITLSEKVNYLVGAECLSPNLSIEDFIEIAKGDVQTLSKYIKDTCKKDNGERIDIQLITEYAGLISDLHRTSSYSAQEKVQKIYRISRTGLYSDGNDSNSPFDLVIDLENINSIIFEMKKNEMYAGKDTTSLKDFGKNLLSNPLYKEKNLPALSAQTPSSNSVFSAGLGSLSQSNSSINQTGNTLSGTNLNQKTATGQKDLKEISTGASIEKERTYSDLGYVCLDSTNKKLSGLDNFFTNEIIKNIEKKDISNTGSQTNNSQNQNLTNTGQTQTGILSILGATNSGQEVAKIQDLNDVNINSSGQTSGTSNPPSPSSLAGGTSQYQSQIQSLNSESDKKLKDIISVDINKGSGKCLNFFCILIDFKTYTQNLFGAAGKLNTIESIVRNSNNHLKKYAYTDLTQKMLTLAHYEDNNKLHKKGLKLKDIFSFNIIVFSRQIPLINTDKNKTKEEKYKESSPYGAMGLIEQYYNSFGIEAGKANSIENIQKIEEQIKSIQDSSNIDIFNVNQKYDQFLNQLYEDQKDNRAIPELLYSKQKHDNIDFMFGMFSELASFTNSFEIYVKGIRTQILKMDKKPTR